MAQYRQSGHHYSNGTSDHVSVGIRASSSSSSSSSSALLQKPARQRRSTRSDKTRPAAFSIPALILFLCVLLLVTALAYYYISTFSNTKDINDHRLHSSFLEDDNDTDFLTNVTRTDAIRVRFGQGSAGHGRDSRYWDKDDRRRDEDYGEDDVENANKGSRDLVKTKNVKEKVLKVNGTDKVRDRKRIAGLYNENGRKELEKYEAEYEASLKDVGKLREGNGMKSELIGDEDDVEQNEGVDNDNEYDDGIDSHDPRVDKYGDSQHKKEEHSGGGMMRDEANREKTNVVNNAESKDQSVAKNNDDSSRKSSNKGSNLKSQIVEELGTSSEHVSSIGSQSTSKPRSDSRKKPKRRKYSGSCVMKFLNSTAQLVEPFESRKFARFSLQYSEMEKLDDQEQWEPRFAGHQSLKEREESFLAHDQKINCGFVKGPEGSPSTGFDLTEDDTSYLSRCHIAVISCIFGNSDRLRSPATKMVTRLSKKNVCFVMFVDEVTLHTLSSEGHMPDRAGFIGLWRIVVVKNLPYTDMRRVGKVPKLLPHRLFPSARYSIWLDSKLRLQQDPLLLLEYFLWRKGYEYAISNHYDRHCVWEEVAQNKRLNKYNHTVIDDQFSFYRADGLKRFSAADLNKLLPSNVPEGSLIIRAHTPMSNLFSCLWFNEVDRFTPRDQLSFAYTYQKLKRMNPEKPFYLNMFKDCERRAIAKLFRHRSDEKKNILQQEATE